MPRKSTIKGGSLESEIETLRRRVTELEAELSRRAAVSAEDGYRCTVELNPHVTWTCLSPKLCSAPESGAYRLASWATDEPPL